MSVNLIDDGVTDLTLEIKFFDELSELICSKNEEKRLHHLYLLFLNAFISLSKVKSAL